MGEYPYDIIQWLCFIQKGNCLEQWELFGLSLNHYPGCQHLPGPTKKQLTKKTSLIKNVYENIAEIIMNVTHQGMLYVDIRKLSVRELSEARDFNWVNCGWVRL